MYLGIIYLLLWLILYEQCLLRLMENRQRSRYFSEKLKIFTSSNYHKVEYFLLRFCTFFSLTNVYKRVFEIFLNFVQTLSYLKKLKKCLVLHTHRNQVFHIFINNSRTRRMKKCPNTLLQEVENVCKISAQNFKFYGRAHQSFNIFKVFSKFRY